MDTAKLFDAARASVFGGKLAQSQVDGINALLAACQAEGVTDPRMIAYVLATAFHETATTMRPIAEYGKGKGQKYGVPGHNHGQIAYGRGFVQTTWDANYERTDKELGLGGRLVANYDLMLTDVAMAAKAAVLGMRDGWYTGKKLSNYFNATTNDPTNARRIINGTDRAALIAGYSSKFLAAIQAAI